MNEKKKKPGFRKGFEEERSKLRLGYQIYMAREKSGLTQAELAHKIGTRQSNISRLEQGDYNFTVSMLEKITKALSARLQIEVILPEKDKAA